MESRFGLVMVAVDEYEELSALPSTTTAAQLAGLLGPYGAEILGPPAPTTADVLRRFLGAWSTSEEGPASSFVYWVGHGVAYGPKQWLLASGSKDPYVPGNAVPAVELAENLMTRWYMRVRSDPQAWTVLILDCCNAEVGISNIVHALSQDPSQEPDRLAIYRVASGASTVGRFVQELSAALAIRTENDDTIPLQSLLREVSRRLGEGLKPIDWLPYDAVLVNPRRTETVVSMNVDLLDEWRGLVNALPREVRSHFVNAAQSAEVGELAWNFAGRHDELRRLAAWLRERPAGLLVVTGEPGAGKSALLGQVVTLADEAMAAVLTEAGLLDDRGDDERPPAGVFDAIVHLTGKTLSDVVAEVAKVLPAAGVADARGLLDGVAALDRPFTVLVDALDESQEPVAIADRLLRPLGDLQNARVVVGTRRSLLEGPDLPEPDRHELLEALGVTVDDAMFLLPEPEAMAEYARRRLRGRAGVDAETVNDVAGRMAALDQPFLYVRLATNELLARADDGPAFDLDRLLTGSHRHLFALAIERFSLSSPAVVTLLRALAYTQGRGLPPFDRVWATVAEALDPKLEVSEAQLDEAVRLAAAYVTLDGEAGQSVYRLAHKTFAEHFLAQDGDLAGTHGHITTGLRASVTSWPEANPYVLLHLLDHAWADAAQLEATCTDPGFLSSVLRRFGADRLATQLFAARDRTERTGVAAVAGAVRRARVALAREPGQLAGQLSSRLHAETDPALVALVARLPEIAPSAWLRATSAPLSWRTELETAQEFPAQVRAIAFGEVAGTTVLAVGSGGAVHLWDPLAGAPDPRTLPNGDAAIVALGLGSRGGQPVAVVAARDASVTVRDLRSNAVVLRLTSPGVTSVCLGQVAGREVIAGAHTVVARWWDAETGELLGERPLDEGVVAVAMAPWAGRVLLAAANWFNVELSEIDGTPLGAFPHGLGDVRAVTVANVAHRVFVSAGNRDAVLGTWEWLGRVADLIGTADAGFPVRAVAVAPLDVPLVVAAAEDGDEVGRVALRYASPAEDRGLSPAWLRQPLAVARLERGLVAVCDESPPVLRSVPSGAVVDGSPPAEEVARVLLGDGDRGADVVDGAGESAVLRSRPASSRAPKKASLTTYRRREPRSWPITASGYGLLDGRVVYAAGSYGGGVWIWDVKSRRVRGEPFGDPPESLPGYRLRSKPGVPSVSSVSMCTAGDRTYLASVCDGAVQLYDVATRETVGAPSAGRCGAVALGAQDGRLVMAVASDTDTVRLFDVDAGTQLAALTLDRGIVDLWLVPGEQTVVVLDASFEVLVLNW